MIIILAALAISIRQLLRRRAEGFIGAWFFLILAPTSSVIPIADLAVEHRMYLPLAALVMLVVVVGWMLAEQSKAGRVLAAAGACLVVLAAGYLTIERNRLYHDPIEMWTDVV